jgi:2-methylcitrate dehydratase PrpD
MDSQQGAERTQPAAELAPFVSELTVASIPSDIVSLTERIFVDEVGVLLAGMGDEVTKKLQQLVSQRESSLAPPRPLGPGESLSEMDTALVLGAAGHSLDYNNTTMGAIHPSVAPIAAILAVGNTTDASGTELVTSYVAGFETQCYLGAAVLPSHYERGWHPTSTLGIFGATAATARLLELSPSETAQALNLAASMASGLCVNFGTLAKPFHAGHAARSAVTAARLAADGFTAGETALGTAGGFIDLYSDVSPDTNTAFPAVGVDWMARKHGIEMKKYPCCSFSHAGISAVERLRDTHELTPEDVSSVDVAISEGAIDCLQYATPSSATEARFSLPYLLASVIVNGTVGLETFDEGSLTDPRVAELQQRIDVSVDDELQYQSHRTTVQVHTVSDETHTLTQEAPPGSAENPLSDEELRQKFDECVDYSPLDVSGTMLYANLRMLSECPSLRHALDPIHG